MNFGFSIVTGTLPDHISVTWLADVNSIRIFLVCARLWYCVMLQDSILLRSVIVIVCCYVPIYCSNKTVLRVSLWAITIRPNNRPNRLAHICVKFLNVLFWFWKYKTTYFDFFKSVILTSFRLEIDTTDYCRMSNPLVKLQLYISRILLEVSSEFPHCQVTLRSSHHLEIFSLTLSLVCKYLPLAYFMSQSGR